MGVFDYIKNKKKDFDTERKTGLKTYSEPKEKEDDNLIQMEQKRRQSEKRSEFFGKVKAKGQAVGLKAKEKAVTFGRNAKEGIKAKFLQARENSKKGNTLGFLGGTGKSQSIFTGGTLSGKPNPIFSGGFGSSQSPFVSKGGSNKLNPHFVTTVNTNPFGMNQPTTRRKKRKGKKVVLYLR